MQRYRVNYRLLAGLVIGSVLLAGGSTLLWMFQINRNASKLLARADAAEESGDLQEAFDSLYQYSRLRQDELDARRRLSTVAAELAQKNLPGTKEWSDAYGVLADSVIRTDDKGIRRQLVDVQAKYGFFDLALANVEDLLAKGETDPELKVLKARCLFVTQKQGEAAKWCYDLIGYDQKTGKKKIDNYKDENGQYHYVASFSGFVPAENPALTISVTIDEPPFGPNRFGASAAAPLFAQVASEALRMLAVPPSTGGECPGAAS